MSRAVIEPAAVEVTATASPASGFEQWEHHAQETCGTLQVLGDPDDVAGGRIVTFDAAGAAPEPGTRIS